MTDTPEWGQITRKPDKATLLAIAEAHEQAAVKMERRYGDLSEPQEYRVAYRASAFALLAVCDALRAKAGE